MDEGGNLSGLCVACDCYGSLDESGLCEGCHAKLQRDMVRERAWDYSLLTWAQPPERREEIRAKVIAQYGKRMELLADEARPKKKKRKRPRRRPQRKQKR